MKKAEVFRNCKIARSAKGVTLLVEGPEELVELMDGDFFEDNCSTDAEKTFPKTAGFYTCDVEFWIEPGFCEGYPAPGESSHDLRLANVKNLSVFTNEMEAMRECVESFSTQQSKV